MTSSQSSCSRSLQAPGCLTMNSAHSENLLRSQRCLRFTCTHSLVQPRHRALPQPRLLALEQMAIRARTSRTAFARAQLSEPMLRTRSTRWKGTNTSLVPSAAEDVSCTQPYSTSQKDDLLRWHDEAQPLHQHCGGNAFRRPCFDARGTLKQGPHLARTQRPSTHFNASEKGLQ